MSVGIESRNLMPMSELISLKKKKALITGSARGIGEAVAHRFAEAGGDLELVDIDIGKLREVRDELSSYDVAVNIHEVDLSRKGEIDLLWEGMRGKGPDILVNNAGVYPFRGFLDVDEAFLRRVVGINMDAVFWMCQHMIRRRMKTGGVIVNIASIEAILPFKEDLSHYGVSKAGVISITRSLAKEYGGQGFRVNAIIPGGIMTPGTKSAAREVLKLNLGLIKSGIEFRHRLPLKRAGQPDEVACMVLVLASDVSSYVNGALIPVDGGFLSA